MADFARIVATPHYAAVHIFVQAFFKYTTAEVIALSKPHLLNCFAQISIADIGFFSSFGEPFCFESAWLDLFVHWISVAIITTFVKSVIPVLPTGGNSSLVIPADLCHQRQVSWAGKRDPMALC
jgi:hypothetical protein